MDRLNQRLDLATKALRSFEMALEEDLSQDIFRDAAILRFQYTLEAIWKAVQRYLKDKEALEAASPKAAARFSFQTGLLDEATTEDVIRMVDDRNLTVHTYNEELAASLGARLRGHATLLRVWHEAVLKRTGP